MKRSERWAFIINPVAGNGFAGRYIDEIRAAITRHGIEADISITKAKGHATELAREYLNKHFNFVVAVGGDGTAHEIIQCLAGQKKSVFASIPAGSGNDFISILGFPERFSEQDWHTLFEKHTVSMDLGKCNDLYFVNGMGLGFDAQVAYENYRSRKGPAVFSGKKTKYMWHVIKTLVLYRDRAVDISMNGSSFHKKTFLNTIAVGRRLAGGFFLTPRAIADDGLLDICIVDDVSFFRRVEGLLSVLRGTHLSNTMFHYHQTGRIIFDFGIEVPAHLDGEMYFNSRFDVSIVPGGLRTLYNPNGTHFFSHADG